MKKQSTPTTPVVLCDNEFVIRLDKPLSEFVSEGGTLQLVNPHKVGEHDEGSFKIIKHLLDQIQL